MTSGYRAQRCPNDKVIHYSNVNTRVAWLSIQHSTQYRMHFIGCCVCFTLTKEVIGRPGSKITQTSPFTVNNVQTSNVHATSKHPPPSADIYLWSKNRFYLVVLEKVWVRLMGFNTCFDYRHIYRGDTFEYMAYCLFSDRSSRQSQLCRHCLFMSIDFCYTFVLPTMIYRAVSILSPTNTTKWIGLSQIIFINI